MSLPKPTDEKLAPQLPAGGGATILSTISQSLSFHSSPDAFLSSRQHGRGAEREQSRVQAVRAKILNRDVAVVSSYEHCRQILSLNEHAGASSPLEQRSILAAHPGQTLGRSSFGILPAYRELMADFFPPPNLLLMDAPAHEARRRDWNGHMSEVCRRAPATILEIAKDELSSWPDGTGLDLYDRMKDLSWKILLALFLRLDPTDKTYSEVVSLQEDLLRGQFSLVPVSISTPFWSSPRARGLRARRKLQEVLKRIIDAQHPACPFHHGQESNIPQEELASNALLFTSSIAVKALASLLTASLLNLFLFPGEQSLANQARQLDPGPREAFLQSILLETERLSPPVIGVMRRAQQDIILKQDPPPEGPDTLVPTGWDAWLYFVGAARNESVYEQAGKFVPTRFVGETQPPPVLTFGFGDKTCLGRDITRQIVQTVAAVMVDSGMDLHGSVDSEGVRAWLGWDGNVTVESIARDVKQLPCQRPRRPIMVRTSRKT